ncbi:hypothetical protein GCM10010381_46990 [Streptomyces xantholiticus]|nr:hypothetical protein GCM10010381_46990 [Streptomyces xantholiticus]
MFTGTPVLPAIRPGSAKGVPEPLFATPGPPGARNCPRRRGKDRLLGGLVRSVYEGRADVAHGLLGPALPWAGKLRQDVPRTAAADPAGTEITIGTFTDRAELVEGGGRLVGDDQVRLVVTAYCQAAAASVAACGSSDPQAGARTSRRAGPGRDPEGTDRVRRSSAGQPSTPVSPWPAPTGLDSGEPRWRR